MNVQNPSDQHIPLQASNVLEIHKAVLDYAKRNPDCLAQNQAIFNKMQEAGTDVAAFDAVLMALCSFYTNLLKNIVIAGYLKINVTPATHIKMEDDSLFIKEIFQENEDPDLVKSELSTIARFLDNDNLLEDLYQGGMIDFETLCAGLRSPRRAAIYMNIFLHMLMANVYEEPYILYITALIKPEVVYDKGLN